MEFYYFTDILILRFDYRRHIVSLVVIFLLIVTHHLFNNVYIK